MYIREYIREDKAENGDQCLFTNDDLYSLQGYSDEDVAQGKVEYCMGMDGLDKSTNDQEFDYMEGIVTMGQRSF